MNKFIGRGRRLATVYYSSNKLATTSQSSYSGSSISTSKYFVLNTERLHKNDRISTD
jgi:hypothetical protein